MFCPKCNSSIPEDSVFCPVCKQQISGQSASFSYNFSEEETEPSFYEQISVPENSSPSASEKPKKTNVFAIILSVLLAVSIGIIIYSFSENSKLSDENAAHLSTIHDRETKIGFLERSVDAKDKEIGDLRKQSEADTREKAALSAKVEYSKELMQVLGSEEKWGYATENFHVDKGVMVIDRFGGMQELKLYSNYYTTFTFEVSDTSVCIAKWSDEEWINKDTTVFITPVSAGFATLTFSNDLYDTTFKVLVIVE